ncbi:MAG: SPOR domain-containing protein [Treponema sp.]|nr:SPOR domain-containing protein [Treponema sp.]
MKKIITFVTTIFTVAILFAAARPSLDGRAVVADSGEMPKGLFARTIGYLPGDSVTVTNPATGSSVDVLILGSIDSSEGVAILLSPEAAERLDIRKDSNVQVKITKRSGSLDETVSGTAVLAESEDDNFVTSDSLLEEVTPIEETANTENNIEETTDETVLTEQPVVEETETITEVTEEPIDSEELAEVVEESTSEPVLEEQTIVEEVETSTEELTAPAESSEVVTDKVEDFVVEETNEIVPTEEVEQPVETEELSEVVETETVESEETPEIIESDIENVPTADSADEVETVEVENIENAETSEEIQSEIVETEKLAEVEETVPAITETEESVTEETLSPVNEEIVLEPTEPTLEEETTDSESEETEKYEPIILVPTDVNPPEEELDVQPVAVNEEKTEEVAVENKEEPIQQPITVEPSDNNMNKYLKDSLKDLESGKYYVQIASLRDQSNIDAILNKYAEKYPIVLVPLTSGKAYQVLVGPLNINEYGMIMERFKSYGFKDCFLRKIK